MPKRDLKMIFKKKRNIILITAAIIAVLVVVILIVVLATLPDQSSSEALESGTCDSEECVNFGNRMKTFMKPEADPCDDFYEYSCGNYDENAVDISEIENHVLLNRKKLKKLLETYQGQTKSEKIALVFLKKCKETRSDPALNEDIWNSNDLTEILIEMAKVEPEHTGFIKNDITFTPKDGKSILFLNMKMEDIYNGIIEKILEADGSLKAPSSAKVIGSSFNFLKLDKYFASLLPEDQRSTLGKSWDAQLVPNDFKVLEKVVAQLGVNTIKAGLKTKWKKKLNDFLVNSNDLEEDCFMKAEKLFPGTLFMISIKNFVSMENIATSNRLFEDLRTVFHELLDENTWLERDLKSVLKKELEAMESSLGVPDEHKELSNVDRMYAQVEKEQSAEDQSYLTLVRNLLKMNSEETFLRVARAETRTFAGHNPMIATMNYAANGHRISAAPFFLNAPFIDPNLPKWNMIASIGLFIAHEMGHAFDAKNFFADTANQPYSTISAAMKTEFDNRNQCIAQKYSQFKFPDGDTSDGVKTNQEDSADSIGFNVAYKLFKKIGGSRKLIGFMDKTVEQVYFQRMAYVWCSKELKGDGLKHQKKDIHSAAKFRVNGMMSNSPEFARAFGCANNSPMNPEKKCALFK